jgi:antitoxin component YwqK of YwqJK toxin-antitoxin module
MRSLRNFLLLFILLELLSCGKRKQIIDGGTLNGMRWEMYLDNDSCYRAWYNGNIVVKMDVAPTEKDMRDSTFVEKGFYATGRPEELKHFLHGKDHGEWKTWFDTGELQTRSVSENGALVEYVSYYRNGHARVEGTSHPGKPAVRTEYFENGNPDQEFVLDSVGHGHCKKYFPNGKLKTEGDVYYYSQATGFWKRWDSLGNALTDTLYGLPKVK